jgi:hypothetical protein
VRLFGLVVATILIFPLPATAQHGQQIFDLFLQGAQQEIYRQQQLEFERQQRQELKRLYQQFVTQWQMCHRGDVAACDAALSYPGVSFNDRQALFAKRDAIVAAQQEAAEQVRRQRIEAAERERAEAVARERAELARQRAEAAWQRQRAEQADQERRNTEAQLLALRMEQARFSVSALLWPWGALLLVALFALASVIVLSRRFLPMDRLKALWAGMTAYVRRSEPSQPRGAAAPEPPTPPSPPPLPAAKSDAPRDTAGAIAALELALAYIEEVRDADRPRLDDMAERKQQLNTLALAAKQLDLANRLDPDAILEGSTEDVHYRFSVNELKAEALLLEGTTHQLYDLKRAIPALVGATELNPKSPHAFYVLGLTYAANMSKAKAVAAFEQAVALDPKNITYRKELNRAQSLSGGEIAAYRATRAGEKLFDAGIKTANAGIMAWNIFAVIWNVLTFPPRMVFAIFRLLRLHPFA